MKQLFLDIKAHLLAQVPELAFIQMFNNQFDLIESQETYSFPFPCCFVEFLADNYVNGAQVNNHVPSNYNVVIPQYLPKQIKRIGRK